MKPGRLAGERTVGGGLRAAGVVETDVAGDIEEVEDPDRFGEVGVGVHGRKQGDVGLDVEEVEHPELLGPQHDAAALAAGFLATCPLRSRPAYCAALKSAKA